MTTPMTEQQFEEARVAFGADLAIWPTSERQAAEAFLETPEGIALRAELDVLDALLAREAARAPDADSDAFLDRLLDIPGQHAQLAVANTVESGSGFRSLMRDVRGLFSPLGLVSQGVAYAAVLAVGVFVGLQTPAEDVRELDLSASMFASDADFYFGDQ